MFDFRCIWHTEVCSHTARLSNGGRHEPSGSPAIKADV